VPPRKLDPKAFYDICNVVGTRMSENIRSYFRSEMELIKNEIMRAIDGVPRNVPTSNTPGVKKICS
jgi:hypothetical protein